MLTRAPALARQGESARDKDKALSEALRAVQRAYRARFPQTHSRKGRPPTTAADVWATLLTKQTVGTQGVSQEKLHRLGPVAARTLIAYVGEIERQVKESQTSQAADFFLVGPPRRAASASVSHTPSPLQLTAQPAVLPRRSAPTSSSSRSTSADSPHRTASTHTAASSALRQSSTPTTLRRRGSSQTSGAHRSWSTPGCQ